MMKVVGETVWDDGRPFETVWDDSLVRQFEAELGRGGVLVRQFGVA